MTLLRATLPVAVLCLLFSLSACEMAAQKQSSFLPAQARAPQVKAAAPQKPQASPSNIQETPKPQPQADPADALIAQAEKQYAAGQANYQSGHLEAAKEDF